MENNNNNNNKMLTLTSADGQDFVVPEVVAKKSQMIRGMIEENCIITNIPLPNVNADILTKVLEYCQKHSEEEEKAADVSELQPAEEAGSSSSVPSARKASNSDLNEWDMEFMKGFNVDMLHDLILACNYLNVEGLLNLTAQSVADLMKGKTVEQIRETFNIKGDFTPEEEEEIRNENKWAFE